MQIKSKTQAETKIQHSKRIVNKFLDKRNKSKYKHFKSINFNIFGIKWKGKIKYKRNHV